MHTKFTLTQPQIIEEDTPLFYMGSLFQIQGGICSGHVVMLIQCSAGKFQFLDLSSTGNRHSDYTFYGSWRFTLAELNKHWAQAESCEGALVPLPVGAKVTLEVY